ncbi:BQ5605_C029g10727 [Microbotryum silenes-dioicae]|uniref:BQ5605_C029g10727 protein n=1 Tax=Microbotryum silenes-dioicae TaxID=796604 RepID=A0A2X0NC50_9BASI|nr:BQ5605_C029g10727 [Microbotryum silenes-dioicae]
MKRKLRNKRGARAGIGPAAGEITRALRQLRASKSPPQGGGLAGARDDRGASVELRVDSSHNVLATHVLAMVPSCLDSFRLTFMDEQRNRRDLPELTTLTDHICIQLRSAGLSSSHSAMLAIASPCPACRTPGHCLRDCTSRAKCEESTLRSAQDLGARIEPGASPQG